MKMCHKCLTKYVAFGYNYSWGSCLKCEDKKRRQRLIFDSISKAAARVGIVVWLILSYTQLGALSAVLHATIIIAGVVIYKLLTRGF